uniref:Uncharacterized protein n=1 Tax=Chromera velia CCMP2878 TaxID=1169474 RepID=A0A0G4GCU4_9ALVE|eukprot:Cvel_21208.t1-p1 / transcript=Cvel_21208.t1 / gene=Cvel_21208 / organism=Chromera_velia_CCMP2878 / gene_product=hypothetical protein / transcript_product=hypothetical protein / location=Cvel_scaffold1969:20036-20453(+) / protein_length=114 / sequence_SO=supercontig / SO=protein_coding / is_pseudo=false
MWGLKKVRVIVYIDSGPLHDQFRSGKAQTNTTMQGVLEWCIQEIRVIRADLQWIAQARNMATERDDQVRPPRWGDDMNLAVWNFWRGRVGMYKVLFFAQGRDDWGLGMDMKGVR